LRWTRAGRTLGLLGIAGLSAAATVGFGTSAFASPADGGNTKTTAPAEASTTTATVTLTRLTGSTVKSGGTAKFHVVVSVTKNPPITEAKLTLGRSLSGGTVTWTNCGGNVVHSSTCTVGTLEKDTTADATLVTAKYKTDTPITVTAALSGTGADKNGLDPLPSAAQSFIVKKAPTATPTPTKTAKPTPTKSHKPTSHPTKSHTSHSHAAKPPATHHAKTPSVPQDNGHVPLPTTVPTSGLPSVPNGTQSPFPFDPPTSTAVPTLPTVAPSPDGPVRTPNVADPQKKATGLVRSDAVSVPAAAAAAFIGLGAGTLITRAVRRRGLWHPIGRHRE
jgi:hypothetical protein